ncbi:MAG: XTP/dITP diphosphatase [Lentisphaerae bacterium]|nr:XTP/dITP diphosphatase [Lentisphaerota bacterium]
MKLLIATRNAHKLEEIRAILAVPGLELLGAMDIPGLPDVVEDGQTFPANAVKKAVTVAMASKLWTLADDSGLEVDALGGAPGVCSARYAGEPCDTAANNAKLLKELSGQTVRTARFRCVLALAMPAGRAQIVEGVCEGTILDAPRGTNGFGYDPLFVPRNHSETFAEMEAALKNRISHRAKALCAARETWGEIFEKNLSEWPQRPARRTRTPAG